MPSTGEKDVDEEFVDFKFKRGENWTQENIHTLTQWAHIAAMSCDLYNESTIYYRNLMRRNTVFNLIISSFAGIASLSQFSLDPQTNEVLSFILKGFFSLASILVALNSGFLKIYEIQERLEGSIRLQNAWTQFGSRLSSEMQLPVALRKDALYMIIKLKETYHELIKDQIQVNKNILAKVAIRNGLSPQALTITDLFERSIQSELLRIEDIENRDISVDEGLKSNVYIPSTQHFVPERVPSRTFTFFENKKDREIKNLTQKTFVQRNAISNAVMSVPSRSASRASSQTPTVPRGIDFSSDYQTGHEKVLASIHKKVPVVPPTTTATAGWGDVGDSSRSLVFREPTLQLDKKGGDAIIELQNPMLKPHPELPNSDSEGEEGEGSVKSVGSETSNSSSKSGGRKF